MINLQVKCILFHALDSPCYIGLSFALTVYVLILPAIVLYCIVLYCIVLYCIVLYCIVLYCIVVLVLIRLWDKFILCVTVKLRNYALLRSCMKRSVHVVLLLAYLVLFNQQYPCDLCSLRVTSVLTM